MIVIKNVNRDSELKRLLSRFDDSPAIRFPTIHLTEISESKAESPAESKLKR
jgi:hypothetical protein